MPKEASKQLFTNSENSNLSHPVPSDSKGKFLIQDTRNKQPLNT